MIGLYRDDPDTLLAPVILVGGVEYRKVIPAVVDYVAFRKAFNANVYQDSQFELDDDEWRDVVDHLLCAGLGAER